MIRRLITAWAVMLMTLGLAVSLSGQARAVPKLDPKQQVQKCAHCPTIDQGNVSVQLSEKYRAELKVHSYDGFKNVSVTLYEVVSDPAYPMYGKETPIRTLEADKNSIVNTYWGPGRMYRALGLSKKKRYRVVAKTPSSYTWHDFRVTDKEPVHRALLLIPKPAPPNTSGVN